VTDVLPFAKFHGARNDFVIVDGRPDRPADGLDLVALAVQMCDRHAGIGADGLLIASPVSPDAAAAGAAARMRMLNPDGGESEMCGNGLRCFARWLADAGELPSSKVTIETGAGLLSVTLNPDGSVSALMGVPTVGEHALALSPAVDRVTVSATRVSMGNPHAVFFVPDVDAVPLERVGPRVETHPAFPRRTNVEFVQVLSFNRLRVRVWERGAGATQACGTGACAAHVAARVHGLASERATLELPGGTLEVTWPGEGHQVRLTGPAVRVFDGRWPL
jgi:diaminopimelate epimerase